MKLKKRHINIPVFIPHLGCPNTCVFCNQRSISGVCEFKSESVIEEIEQVLTTLDNDQCEIELAFFGGSFTGIDPSLMVELLEIGKGYMDRGVISSVRCSTRPDYINKDIITILKRYGVKTVELGIQSMDDTVLCSCRRGHDSETTKKAVRLLIDADIEVVGQMMIGLPGADMESEIECARYICLCGATCARVYPTVVFRETELEKMSERGEYSPLSVDDAVYRTKRVLDVFDRGGINVIRVGLCASENLSDDSVVYAGANDSAIGERAMSALFCDRIEEAICGCGDTRDKNLVVYVPNGAVSKVSGHKKSNKNAIIKKYGFKSFKIIENQALFGYNIKIDIL